MKKALYFAAALLALAACKKNDDPAPKPIAEIDEPFEGSIKVGVEDDFAVIGEGFQETDSVYVACPAYAEGIPAENLTITEYSVSFGIDAYSALAGKTGAVVYLYRDGKTLALSKEISIEAATAEDGFLFPDKALLDALWLHNTKVRDLVTPLHLISDVQAIRDMIEAGCDNEWGILAADGNGATSYVGLEYFENLGKGMKTMADQEYPNFICWGCGNIEEIDFSNWNAWIQVRAASCGSLKKVILGPNMKGGDFDQSPVEYFDMHLCHAADWVMNLKNLKYADLTRTYIQGGSYGTDFNHWRGSGNVKNITFTDDAEIHIDSEVYGHNWTGGGVRNNIKAAWQNGAKVFVHDIWDYEAVHQIPTFAEDPTAMDAPED